VGSTEAAEYPLRASAAPPLSSSGAVKPIMFQDDEYGKNVLDGFTQQLAAMKIKSGTETSYKRGVSDFSAQVARMKADGCDLVMLGTVIRETIGAMTEARKIGWTVEFLGAGPTNVIEVPLLGKDAVEGLYAAALFEIPYEDTAQGKVKEWLANYKKMFGIAANTQAIIGYNAIETFAFYANLAGRDLTGQSLLAALESGKEFHDIFGSPPVKFSPTNHLASAETMIQQIQNGRWKVIQAGSLLHPSIVIMAAMRRWSAVAIRAILKSNAPVATAPIVVFVSIAGNLAIGSSHASPSYRASCSGMMCSRSKPLSGHHGSPFLYR
jgi:branched-chain amino acid transport system substrate-binding protein